MLVTRPALVIARRPTDGDLVLLWALMITNAIRPGWDGDVMIEDWRSVGLIIPSKVRTAKISSTEERSATSLGKLDAETWRAVMKVIGETLDLP